MNYQKIAFSLALLLSFGVSIRSAEAQAQYNVVDLETLGGSDSYAFDVNESGHVVGYSKRAHQEQ